MFGTILPDRGALSEEQLNRYQSLYCGLCRTLQQEYGILARLTLSYDMTFLIMLLASLYEPTEKADIGRCVIHPLKSHTCTSSKFTSYAAAMNVSLAYYKALDDWHDDRNVISFLQAKLLHRCLKKAESRYEDPCKSISDCLTKLSELEHQKIMDPDAAAACFGKLTGTLFSACSSDYWTVTLQKLGNSLGQFIYLSDALIDLEQDIKKGRYNPLKEVASPKAEEDFLPCLQLIIGDCAKELELLPLVQDLDILRNIIYSGVWIPYTAHCKKKAKRRNTHV